MTRRSLLSVLAVSVSLTGLTLAHAPAARAADEVTMSLQEFLAYYDKATKPPEKPDPKDPPPPRAFSITSADYTGEVVTVDGEPSSVVFTGRFRIDVHTKEGWLRLPLLTADVAVAEATVGGRPAALLLEGNQYTLVTEERGTLDVELTFAVQVSTNQGQSRFYFPLVPAGTTRTTFTVPGGDALDVTVAGARKVTQSRVDGGRRIEALVPPRGTLDVRWQRDIEAAPVADGGDDEGEEPAAKEPKVYAEVFTLASIGDGLMTAKTRIDHTVLFAGVDTFQARIPEGATVLDVRGAGLRDWSLSEDGVLTAELNYAAEGRYALSIDLERPIGDGDRTEAAPLVRPVGVQRTKGWLGVEVQGTLEVDAGEVKGATPVDVRTLPGAILGVTSQPVLLGFKYLDDEVAIPLVLDQHDEEEVLVTLIDQARATTMFTADGRRLSSVVYEVRNHRQQFLRLTLPDGAELWSAAVAGRAVQPARNGDELLVPLIRSADSGRGLASFGVEVVYVESGSAPDKAGRGSFRAALPRTSIPTTYVGWTVYAPEEAKVRPPSRDGSLQPVEFLTNPLGAGGAAMVVPENAGVRQSADAQVAAGGMGSGAAPVRVKLPLQGTPYFHEKLLALDEELWVGFDYTGLKRK